MTNIFKIAVFLCCFAAVPSVGFAIGLFVRALLPGFPIWIMPLVLLLGAFSLPMSYALPKCGLRKYLRRVGEIAIGLLMYLTAGVIAGVVLWLFGCEIVLSGIIGAAVFVLLYISAVINAFFIRTRHYKVESEKPEKPVRIALISDLHFGFATDKGMAKRIAAKISAAKPDAVFIAGDIFDAEFSGLKYKPEVISAFSGLGVRIIACEGNHDLFDPAPERDNFFADCGIELLRDSATSVCGLSVTGRLDRSHKPRLAADELPCSTGFRVVLDHRPADIDALFAAGFDMVLCGHTHGGQTFPGNLLLALSTKYGYGRYSHGEKLAIVTSGAGFWGIPLRLGVCNEVAVVDIGKKIPRGVNREA